MLTIAQRSPHLILEVHPTKNGDNNAYNIIAGSNRKVWWICNKGHEWQAAVCQRAFSKRPTGCPFCSNRKVCIDNCLPTTHPNLLKEWDYDKNTLTPYDIIAGSGRKVWWKCGKSSDHEWQASVQSRTTKKRNCPFCFGDSVCLSNCLYTTHPNLLKEWDYDKNTPLTPFNVTYGSHKKVWWKCDKGHQWRIRISNRTTNACSCCPVCNESKGERKIFEILTNRNIKFHKQVSFDSCRNINKLAFDYAVILSDKSGFLIEYQGEQHFEPISFNGKMNGKTRKNFLEGRKRDEIKRRWCRENKIPLLEIPYWHYDKIEDEITHFIKEIYEL